MRHWFGWVVVLVLVGAGIAVAAPPIGSELQAWMDQIEDRVEALEALHDTTTTTSTIPTTTTTTVTTTTTTIATTTTTEATTTTTTQATTTTAPEPETSLTSDLVITEDETRTGFTIEGNGHQILIDGADVTWTDFEIRNVGRVMWHNQCGVATLTDGVISDSGVTNQTGFYPIHFHLCGDTTRGSVLEKVTIRNAKFNGFVPHGSNGITIRDSACDGILGACLWWDPPGSNEECNIQRNCTLDNSNDILVDNLHASGTFWLSELGTPRFHAIAAIELGAGSGNAIINSTVSGVSGGAHCAGYRWGSAANHNIGGNVWEFSGNRTEDMGDCHGIRVWQNDGNIHPIEDFIGAGVSHGAYTNRYQYDNIQVPYFEVHAVGWTMENSTVGDVSLHKHALSGPPVEWTNVNASSFVVGDAGDEPVEFIWNGANLTCADVEWANPHPNTTVTIDGVPCG